MLSITSGCQDVWHMMMIAAVLVALIKNSVKYNYSMALIKDSVKLLQLLEHYADLTHRADPQLCHFQYVHNPHAQG